MTKLRAVIVDDEPLALKLLRAKLNKIADIEVVAECKNGREAVTAVIDFAPDLVFLDIEMPGYDGFDVIKHLQSDVLPLIVFTTAYEQYALEAFEIHAVDYILKPIDDERIQRAVSRAKERMSIASSEGDKTRIISAIDAIHDKASELDETEVREGSNNQAVQDNVERKIVIKDRHAITLLKQSDIAWIDAAGDYVCLHADGETHIKRSTLKDLLDDLDPNVFKRVHRSTIVNLNFIQKVIPHTKGEFFLQLGEYDRIKVSRNYRQAIKSFLSEG